jgi:hypothetical protein
VCSSAFTKNGNKKLLEDWEETHRHFQYELVVDLIKDGSLVISQEDFGPFGTSDPDNRYPHLVEIIHCGAYRGSWVYPRVAINLAAWCNVKFGVQTNGLISRYTTPEVKFSQSLNGDDGQLVKCVPVTGSSMQQRCVTVLVPKMGTRKDLLIGRWPTDVFS